MVDGIDPSVRLEVPESSLYQVLSFRIDQMEDGARQLPGLGAQWRKGLPGWSRWDASPNVFVKTGWCEGDFATSLTTSDVSREMVFFVICGEIGRAHV